MGKKKEKKKDRIFEVVLYVCLAFHVVSFWAPIVFGEYAYGLIDYINLKLPSIIPNDFTFNNFVIISYIFVFAGSACSVILFYKKREKKFLIILILELILLLMMIWATIESSKLHYA